MTFRIRHGARSLRDPQPKSIREIIRVWKNGTRIPNASGTAKGPILADSMGLGKTASAILAAAKAGLRRILVICPKSAISDWKREIEAWHPGCPMIDVPRNRRSWRKITYGVTLINYDILEQLSRELRLTEWDLIIQDEGHYTKEPTAKRSLLIYGGTWKRRKFTEIPSKYKLMISGTPFKNRIEELFDPLHWLDPIVWSDIEKDFIDEYYEEYTDTQPQHRRIITPTKRVIQNVRPKNLTLLHQRLQSIMVRTNKDDLREADGTPSLPPKHFEKIYIPMMDVLSAERFDIWLNAELLFGRMRLKAQRAGNWDEVEDLDKKLDGIKSKKAQKVAQAKRQETVEYLLSLPRNEKVIIIGFHRNAMLTEITKELKRHGRGYVEHNGDNSGDAKETVNKFQNDPNIQFQFFIGQLNVSSLSLTLTAAHHVVFTEIPNTWADFNQAMDRTHRFRQKHEPKPNFIRVTVLSLDWDYASDEGLLAAILRWRYIADVVLDGKPEDVYPSWNWTSEKVWWKHTLVPIDDPDYVTAQREFELEYLQYQFDHLFGGMHFNLHTREYTDQERNIIKIVNLQYRTQANGCTETEEENSQAIAKELMKRYNITQAEVDAMRVELQYTRASATAN
jgi:SNF2 family DNA or RNA helicase